MSDRKNQNGAVPALEAGNSHAQFAPGKAFDINPAVLLNSVRLNWKMNDDMNRKKITLLTVFLLVLALAALAAFLIKRPGHSPSMAPPEVLVMEAMQRDMPVYSDWIGTLDGFVNAQIRAQVSGYLMAQEYREGSFVKKGDLLFQIDPRPFQAALDKANGQLAQARAHLGKTELDVKRYTPLAKTSAISQEELDDAVQANLAAKAAVDSALAQVHEAELNLGFTSITSPVDGIAGIAEAQVGDLVGPSSPPLTTVSTLDPIKVYFPISEQEYMRVANKIRTDENSSLTNAHHKDLELILVDGDKYPQKGEAVIADRQVNVRTGTIRIAGLFPNPDYILRPGQYAHIRAVTKTCEGAILVPQRAVVETQGSYNLVVVDKDNRASIRPVEMGERSGLFWIVSKGLMPGEKVVVEGTQKAREGALVDPKPYVPDAGSSTVGGANKPEQNANPSK